MKTSTNVIKLINRVALLGLLVFAFIANANAQISVSGEGKIKVKPDQVVINFGIENIGKDAKTSFESGHNKLEKRVVP